MTEKKQSVHVDSAEIHDGIPPFDEQIMHCGVVGETGYGLAGGGFGIYTYCPECGAITSKSQDVEE